MADDITIGDEEEPFTQFHEEPDLKGNDNDTIDSTE